jgi:DNA excision repair protein ERCC-3
MLTPHSLYAAVSVGLETTTILSVLNRLSKV